MKIEEERKKERRERRQKRVSENDKRYFVMYYVNILSVFTICHVLLVCFTILSLCFFDFQQGGVVIAMAGRQDG